MIEKLRRFRVHRRLRGEDISSSELPFFDPHLSFSSEQGECWTFDGDHLFLDGDDVEPLIHASRNDIHALSSLSTGLNAYARYVQEVLKQFNPHFMGMVMGLQGKILDRMGTMYEGLTMGVHVEMVGDRLWFNNIDLCSLMALYRERPTPKAKAYLRSFYHKLALILRRQSDSPRFHGIANEVERVFGELTALLADGTPDDPPRLVAFHRASA